MKQLIAAFKRFKFQILISLISIALGLISVSQADSFKMNPFWIGSLLLAGKVSLLSYIVTFFVTTLCGFIVEINYGIELGIAGALLLIFISLPKIKFLKRYNFLPVALLYACLSPFYLASNFSFNALLNLSLNLAIAVIIALAINSMEKHQRDDFDELILLLSVNLLPLVFVFHSTAYLIALYLGGLLYFSYQKSYSWRASYLLVALLSGYYLASLTFDRIFFFVVPLIPLIFTTKKSLSYTLFFATGMAIILGKNFKTFYLEENFYCLLIAGISSLLVVDLLPRSTDPEIVEQETIGSLKNNIRNIEEYISIILETNPDSNLEKKTLEENLHIKACQNCGRAAECDHCEALAQNLPKPLYRPLKERVLRECPNGSKLIYRYRVVSDMVDHELRKNMVQSEQTTALKTIVEPLKKLCSTASENPVSLNALNNALGGDFLVELGEVGLTAQTKLAENQIEVIENILHRKVEPNYRYVFLDQHYLYRFGEFRYLDAHSQVFSFPKNLPYSGDAYSEYKGLERYEFFQLDAMGHNQTAASTAHLALKLLSLTRIEATSIENRLQELNGIIKCKSIGENYVTLDLVSIDQIQHKISLYKFGSATSFLIRQNNVQPIENSLPPLGILSSIEVVPIELEIQSGDKLILMTDGFDNIDESFLRQHLEESDDDIGRRLVTAYQQCYPLQDDATLTIISFD